MNRNLSTLFALVMAVISCAAVYAQDTTQAPAIGGYSPVSYFTENKAELGSSEFAVAHKGETYFLTSKAQVTLFTENPDRYRPRYKSCPFSLAHGMVLPLDPTNFKIIGDHLLLFHKSEEKDALLEWNSSELSEKELLRRADSNLFLIEF
ncbi:MAG: YHS domain-containing (seleno)protein [Pseudomonadota bacterium]